MKYGELITKSKIVLVAFVYDKAADNYTDLVRIVPETYGTVIQYSENVELFDAIRIIQFPTLIIYIDGQMVLKQSGDGAREAVKQFLEGYSE